MIRTPKTAALLVMTILLPAVTFSHAHDLPEDPLILLTEAAEDPCSICAEQKRRQAFRILNEYFVPGLEIGGSETCRMMKPDREDALVLTCYPSESLRDSSTTPERRPRWSSRSTPPKTGSWAYPRAAIPKRPYTISTRPVPRGPSSKAGSDSPGMPTATVSPSTTSGRRTGCSSTVSPSS